MIKFIRFIIGYIFYGFAKFILPKDFVLKFEEPIDQIDNGVKSQSEEEEIKPIPFSIKEKEDVASYFTALSKEENRDNAPMIICRQLKIMSSIKKAPVKLVHIANFTYTKDPENDPGSLTTHISGYRNNRWYKLVDITPMSSKSVIDLLQEIIESQAQAGWACMNDSAEQLYSYITNCLGRNNVYLENRAKTREAESRICIQTSMVVDVNPHPVGEDLPVPHLCVKISIWPDIDSLPVESAHYVYFSQSSRNDVKLKT